MTPFKNSIMFAASLFLACSAYSQSSLELDGVWISSASNARGVVQKKDDGSFVVTMSYPSGHSDIYLGIITGSDIPNLCSVKGVEPFYACFSATVDSTTLISLTLKSCEDTQGLDICAKLPSTFNLARDIYYSISGIWQTTPEKYFHVDDRAGILSVVEIDIANGDTEDLSGTRNGNTGKVCSTDGDGICADFIMSSETSMAAEIVSCDSAAACLEDPIGTVVNLLKVF